MTPNEYQAYDEKIRIQAEMLTSLISAGLQTQDTADKAVSALEELKKEVEKQIYSAKKSLSTLAESTATETAKLLADKFIKANEAARDAAEQYEKAGRLLGLKTFLTLLGSLSIICTAAWLIAGPLLPSYEEMRFRRNQIAEMESRAEFLAKKGVNLTWEECNTGPISKSLCFRSDGKIYSEEGSDRRYSVPFGSQR